ncbi:MAG: iron-siderophore ABC transporter substrate-binding protein [Chloroflexota bacterium]
MTRLYRLVTTLLTLAILVTACGGQPVAEDGATSPEEATSAEDSAEEVVESEAATGPTEASVDGICETGQRLFDHEMLMTEPVCIPDDPQRVVITWPLGMTSLLRADAPLVGASSLDTTIPQFPGWEDELGEIVDIGNPPNPETILTLDPDLIIGPSFFLQDEDAVANSGAIVAAEMWTAIAPTVVFDWQQHTWRETTDIIFDAAGKADAFDALMAELDERTSELASLIDNPADIELSMVNIGDGYIRSFAQYSPGGMIAEAIGFRRPEGQLLPVTFEEYIANPEAYPEFTSGGAFANVSLEQLDRVDGDFILVSGLFVGNEDNQTALDEVRDTPLWQTLDAVQNDNVHVSDVNFGGGDIGVMHAMLDELAEAFGVADQLSPNPYVSKAEIPMAMSE